MRIGLALPQYEIDVARSADLSWSLTTAARRAEALSLDSVWLSDHPFAVAPDGMVSGAMEAMTTLASLARATRQIAVGTLVLAATMRAPALLRNVARTMSLSAGDRLMLGLGTGWYSPEHRAYGIELPSYRDRIEMLRACLCALDELGERRPSVLVGGAGPEVMELAAAYADIWNVSWDVPADRFRSLSRSLDAVCERGGRDPSSLRRSVGLTVLAADGDADIDAAVGNLRARAPFLAAVTRDALEGRIVVGDASSCAERILAYGADEVVIAPLLRDDEEMVRLLATGVASRLRDA